MSKPYTSFGPSRRPRAFQAIHPVAAGYRPATAALAVAAAFTLQSAPGWAQSVPQAVIHGSATFARNGSSLLVTTTNGAGTSHSAIDWTSFMVPKGSVTSFLQPSVASTSINRVVAPNPSAIFGTLSSNGRLVLVNPAGITVGQGAMVDTAAFTASTLRMSDADALAGRLRFSGGSGLLKIDDGTIRAQGGDIVLIAPQVTTGANAVIRSEGGAVVLAAGQSVEITGRGLEGIHLQVQAGNEAVNLGTLSGDAVGIFANTLTHSGLVQAQAVSTEGGKVVLKATGGDALVSGTIEARGAGGQGGSVDVLGRNVGLLAGARVDASGAGGGGQVRVGGDYQGSNPDVPNAQHAYVDAQASIAADATDQGDGGRVIVWSDDATRMHGRISARGGEQGGNGGFTEVSGKKYLDFTGRVDLRAARGQAGTLLLDPNDIVIDGTGPTTALHSVDVFGDGPDTATVWAEDVRAQLEQSTVIVTTNNSPSATSPFGGRITLASDAHIAWNSGNALTLWSNTGIVLAGTLQAADLLGVANGTVHLHSQAGDIVQQLGSSIKVAGLLVTAGGGVQLDQANRVGTLAGRANGSGSSSAFVFNNAQDLTIGFVGAPMDSAYGLNLLSLGATTVTATAGTLKVRADVGGSDVSLQAPAGNVDIHAAAVQANQKLLVSASGDVLVGREPTTSAATQVNGFGAGVEIGAGGSVLFGGANSFVSVYGAGGAGAGVRITASGGDIDLGAGTSITGFNRPISISAAGSVFGTANLSTSGSDLGTVTVSAGTGSMAFGSINTSGADAAPHAGNVTLSAAGDITGDSIQASGFSNASNQVADGAIAQATSTGGNIQIGSIDANGGDGPGANAGHGGAILLTAQAAGAAVGNVRIGSRLSARGGDASTIGAAVSAGNGGSITVRAAHDIVVGTVSDFPTAGVIAATGGTGQFGAASGGKGGNVSLTSGAGGITLVTSFSTIDARGGGSSEAAAGHGGNVSLQALAGGISIASVGVDGGSAFLSAASSGGNGGSIGIVAGLDIDVAPGAGLTSNGGLGGSAAGGAGLNALGPNITVRSNGGSIRAAGAFVAANGASGAPGGAGGNVLLDAAGSIAFQSVSANGGTNLAAAVAGGQGGVVALTSSGGSIELGSASADGGFGTGTDAGDGGSVSLAALGTGGAIHVGSSLGAIGGNGSFGGTGVQKGGHGGTVTVQADRNVVIGTAGASPTAGFVAAGGGAGSFSVAGSGNGGSGGTISITSVAGSIELVTSSSQIEARAGDGAVGGIGGNISLQAPAGGITMGSAAVDGGGDYGDPNGVAGKGGTISLTAGGAVLVDSPFALSAGGGNSTSGAGGDGGSLSLASTGGSVTINGGLYATAGAGKPGGHGGSIALSADTDLQAQGLEAAGGFAQSDGGAGGTGGTITATAQRGNLTLGSAFADGGSGQGATAGHGGSISLSAPSTAAATGAITIGSSLSARGGGLMASTIAAAGGGGGGITVHAGRDLVIGSAGIGAPSARVDASGSSASGLAGGGVGGTVTLGSDAGSVNLAGDFAFVGASGGDGSLGGVGGSIDIQALAGGVRAGDIEARGGSDWTGSLGGGLGGSLFMQASQDLIFSSASGQSLSVAGGQGGLGAGGGGGGMTLRSSSGSILASGMNISSAGGSGLAGGVGGAMLLDAAVNIVARQLDISGGSGSGNDTLGGGAGGAGGDGGALTAQLVNGSLAVDAIQARGGFGGSAPAGKSGGGGGFVNILYSGGPAVLDAVGSIDASGGGGGMSTTFSAGMAGAGGVGGGITIVGNALTLGGASVPGLFTRGGSGGFDGTAWAAAGAPGNVLASGTTLTLNSMTLSGNVHFRAGTGSITTGLGSTQSWSAGDGLVLDAATEIVLNSELHSSSLFDPGTIRLSALNGSITQPAGFIGASGLVAEATSGVVDLRQANAVGRLAGFGNSFTFYNGGDVLEVGAVANPFGGGSGIQAGGGVELRSRRDLRVLGPVSSTGSAISLVAGDAGIASAVFGAFGGGTGSLDVQGTISSLGGGISLDSTAASAVRSVLQVSGTVDAGSGTVTMRHAGMGDLWISNGIVRGGALSATSDAQSEGVHLSGATLETSGGALELIDLGPAGSSVSASTLRSNGGHLLLTSQNTISIAGSTIASAGGDIDVLATQGGPTSSGNGANVTGSTLDAGVGSIFVTGRSAWNGVGVALDGVNFTSAGGATVFGEQTQSGGFTGGISVSGAVLTGAGTLQLNGGTRGSGVGLQFSGSGVDRTGVLNIVGSSDLGTTGVAIQGSSMLTHASGVSMLSSQTVGIDTSSLDTGGGDLTITGGNSAHSASGVVVSGGSSLHAGTGSVFISGTSNSAAGFVLQGFSGGFTVSGADVSIVGSTVVNGIALLIDNETVSSTNSMRLSALGGGLQIQNGSTVSNTGALPLVMESSGAAGSASFVNLSANSSVTSTGAIQILANSVQLDGLVSSATRTSVRPQDTARTILINGADEAGALNLTQAELDGMAGSATIEIGDTTLTGGISVAASTTIGGGASLSLINGGAIGQQAGATLTTHNLSAVGASVVLDLADIGSGTGGILSGRATSGEFRVRNQQATPAALQIGTVDGVAGVSASGAVSIVTSGLLRLSQPVHSDAVGTAIALVAGDLLRDNLGALETPNGRWLAYLPVPTANLATGPQSGNFALWGRDPVLNPPGSIAETGNRYLFANTPLVDVAANATTKVYDGSASFGTLTFTPTGLVDAASFGNVFLQDVFTGSLAVPTATKNVGSYTIERGSLVQPAGYAFGTYTAATASITPAPLAITGVTGADRTYDGTTAASLTTTATLNGLVAGDDLVYGGGSGSFADRNVGAGKTIAIGSVFLSGVDLGNYSVTFPASTTASITPAPLTVSASTDRKVYDGSTSSAGTPSFSGTLFGGDTVSLAQAFADKNAGTGKTLNASAIVSDGNGGNNYAVTFVPDNTGVIDRASLLVRGLAAGNKVYDATTVAPISGAATVSPIGSDQVTVGGSAAGAFASKDVGSGKPVTVSGLTLGGLDAGNYVILIPTFAADITPATLMLGGVLAKDKVYDTTTAATLSGVASVAPFGSDAVSVGGTGSASFADKNVGAAKPVTLSGFTLSGADAGNYVLAVPTLAASITPATLAVTGLAASDKVYDATVSATLTGSGSVTPLGSDQVSLAGSAAGSFGDKNVGTAKPVAVGGLGLTGADAGNYVLSVPTLAASITPAPLTLSGLAAGDKVYDATIAAALSGTAGVTALAGDDVAMAGTALASFADKNVGPAKPVSVAGVALAGADAGNYALVTPTLSASITPAKLTVSGLTANDKVYDATLAATLTGTAGVTPIGSDAVGLSGTASAAFADKNVGTGKPVALSGLALGGADAGNYVLATPALSASITPARLSLSGLSARDKVYDATTAATLTGTAAIGGVLGTDSVALGGTNASFADKNVGTAKPVSVGGITLTGADAGNYIVVAPTGLAANITPARLTVAGLSANNKVYDGTVDATLSGNPALQGVLATDSVGLSTGSARFGDKNAGKAKPVALSGIGLSGPDAGNYQLVTPAALVADITPAPLTIAASNLSKEEGAALTFKGTEFSAQGLVGSEQVASVTLASAGAPAEAKAGAYPITTSSLVGANGFLAGNYAVTYLNGALAVFIAAAAPAAQVVVNQVTTFATLFVEEAKVQAVDPVKDTAKVQEKKKDKDEDKKAKEDITVTDSACKP